MMVAMTLVMAMLMVMTYGDRNDGDDDYGGDDDDGGDDFGYTDDGGNDFWS